MVRFTNVFLSAVVAMASYPRIVLLRQASERGGSSECELSWIGGNRELAAAQVHDRSTMARHKKCGAQLHSSHDSSLKLPSIDLLPRSSLPPVVRLLARKNVDKAG